MIQVQIATTVERHGVSGLRWVLVNSDAAQTTPVPDAPNEDPSPQPLTVPQTGAPVRRVTLGVHMVCAAVLLFALTSAWWVGSAIEAGQISHSAGAAPAGSRGR